MKPTALLLLVLAAAGPGGAQIDAVWQQARSLRQSGNLAAAYALMEGARKDSSNPSLIAEFILAAVQLPSQRAEGEKALEEMRAATDGTSSSLAMEALERELGGIYSRMARDGGETERPFRAASIEAYRREEVWIVRNQADAEEASVRLAEAHIHRGLELLLANDVQQAELEIRAAYEFSCKTSTQKSQLCDRAKQAMTAVKNAASVRSFAAAPAEGPKDEE
ncbi:hypothetical protein [Terriglobus tenax]|uniref:hypothetical protein n=1 Tax=Terriglobus tenax TaxID=1111115 RepID=UPI0021DF833F|nr:hypothetical protein [Terriglobus tenax]